MLNLKRTLLSIHVLFCLSIFTSITNAAPPQAVDDTRQGTDGFDLVINVLDNDTDPDGDTLLVQSVTQASNGSVTLLSDNRSIEYKPNDNFIGSDFFTYVVVDQNNETDIGTVFIVVSEFNLPAFATNDNQRTLAGALDSFCRYLEQQSDNDLSATQQAILTRCEALFQMAANGQTDLIETALQQIAPEEIAAQADTTMNFIKGQGANIEQRLTELKSGGPQISTGGLSLIINGKTLPGKVLQELIDLNINGHSANGGSAGNENKSTDPFAKLGLFINGNFENGDRDGSDNESPYEWEASGITAGADYRLNAQTILGIAYGYSSNEVDFDNNGGATDTDSSSLILFGTYYYQQYYMDAYLGYGWGDFTSFRNIVYSEGADVDSTFSASANSATDHSQLFFTLSSSKDYIRGPWTFSPYSTIDYGKTSIDGFTESNANGWEITFADRSATSLRTSVGSRATYVINGKSYVFIPQTRLAWIHEFKNGTRSATAHFSNDPQAIEFDITPDNEDSNYFQLALGASIIYTGGISGFFEYETNLGLSNVRDHHYHFGVRYEADF